MTRTLILQSYRASDVPPWIARCLDSVQRWAKTAGHDYRLVGDEAFDLCGDEYLARVGDNVRSITNLARLEMVRNAHREGYDWAAWIDADVFVFDPENFSVAGPERYAFARETWVTIIPPDRLHAQAAVNNCVFVCRSGEPDLAFLITATRHVALHRQIADNYQVGGDLIKGLRTPLAFETLSGVGMFSHPVVQAIALDMTDVMQFQALCHGTPVHAANLRGSGTRDPAAVEASAQGAMDRLEETRGQVLNGCLADAPSRPNGYSGYRLSPGIAAKLEE